MRNFLFLFFKRWMSTIHDSLILSQITHSTYLAARRNAKNDRAAHQCEKSGIPHTNWTLWDSRSASMLLFASAFYSKPQHFLVRPWEKDIGFNPRVCIECRETISFHLLKPCAWRWPMRYRHPAVLAEEIQYAISSTLLAGHCVWLSVCLLVHVLWCTKSWTKRNKMEYISNQKFVLHGISVN
jgi:hypothetical protein